MYQTFIFYIIVILIYTARPERPQELLQVSHCLLLILALFLLFYWIIRKRCRRLQSNRSLSDDRLPGLYDRLQMQLQIGAIIVFSGMVYGADLGALIELLPLVKRSEGLNNLLGLGVFFLLQIIIWSESHRYFAERILLINQSLPGLHQGPAAFCFRSGGSLAEYSFHHRYFQHLSAPSPAAGTFAPFR